MVNSHEDSISENEIFRLIANYTYDWESWIGSDGRPAWINPAVERLTGYTVADCMAMDDYPLALVHPADRERLRELFTLARTGGSGNNVEFKILHRTLRETWGAVSWQPLFDRDGESRGFRTSVRDITARKTGEAHAQQLEADMEQRIAAERALARSERMETLGRLAGGLAHDFNNTLAAVKTFIELAQIKTENAQALQYLSRALEAVIIGANVNRRLLTFARRDAATSVVATNDAIAGISTVIERTLGSDIIVAVSIEPNLWPSRIDRSELESALLNLAINARDAMPEGGTLSILAANAGLPGDSIPCGAGTSASQFVQVSICDTGKGMSRETMNALDAPFFTTKGERGTGLGLNSVREFARNSGGFIRLESTEGMGTKVHIYLPRSHETAKPAPQLQSEQVPLGDGQTILLVEDDMAVLEAVHALLESLAYSVLTARSGRDALDLLEREASIRAIVSDIVMPGGISGYELAAKVRLDHPGLPIVLTSGHNDYTPPDNSKDLPVLRKPYSRSALAEALYAALHQANAIS